MGYSWSTLLWYPCYYPHRLRDALSPVCRIFTLYFTINSSFTNTILFKLRIIVTDSTFYTSGARNVHYIVRVWVQGATTTTAFCGSWRYQFVCAITKKTFLWWKFMLISMCHQNNKTKLWVQDDNNS